MEWKKKDVGIEQTFMSKSMVSTNIDKKQNERYAALKETLNTESHILALSSIPTTRFLKNIKTAYGL